MGWSALASSSLELLSPFVLRTANSVFRRLILSLSLAIPQFKLLSQVSSLRLPSGHSGLVLTLSNAACSSPFRPHLLVVDVGFWGYFSTGSCFRHVICGFYLFFLPVRLPSEIRKLPPDLPAKGFPGVWKLPPLLLPSLMGLCPQLFCLPFYLLYFVLPPSEDNGQLFWAPDVFC